MTRTRKCVVEPSRTPLQARASALLSHTFRTEARKTAASSSRVAGARTPASGGPGSTPAAASSSSSQHPTGSRGSPRLQGGSSSPSPQQQQDGHNQQQRQLSGSLYDLGSFDVSLDYEEYSGLSDFFEDENEQQFTPAGAAEGDDGAAISREPTQQQRRSCSPTPPADDTAAIAKDAAAPAAPAELAAVDGRAYILEASHQAPTTAAAAAAAGVAEPAPAADEPDGFTAVDKMLEQLSVDAMLDQQYMLEHESMPKAAAAAGDCRGLTPKHQPGVVLKAGSRALPYPTGPATADTVLQAAAGATMQQPFTPPGAHQVPVGSFVVEQQQQQQQQGQPHGLHPTALPTVGVVPTTAGGMQREQHRPYGQHQQQPGSASQPLANGGHTINSGVPEAWQQQQQQQRRRHGGGTDYAPRQQPLLVRHLQHAYSDPLPGQGSISNSVGTSGQPFSFQDLLLSDDPVASDTMSAVFDGGQQHQHTTDFQSQSQQNMPGFGTGLAMAAAPELATSLWQQQLHQPQQGAWMQHGHQQQPRQQHQRSSSCSAPLPPPALPHHHQYGHSSPHNASNLHAMHLQQSAFNPPAAVGSPARTIPFYQQQQQQQSLGGHQGYLNPHQAELEALKAQLAEEKRRRKEKKRLRKMQKLMMQQQQQQQGMAHQVLFAANPAAGGAPPPQPPWQNPAPRPQERYPGFSGMGSGTAAARGHSHLRTVNSSPADAAAAAARQHAVAQSLRQLAYRSEQMQKGAAAAAAAGAAPEEAAVPPPASTATGRHTCTPGGAAAAAAAAAAGNGGSSMQGLYGRQPTASPSGDSTSYSGRTGAAAGSNGDGRRMHDGVHSGAPVVLNLQQDEGQPPPETSQPMQVDEGSRSSSGVDGSKQGGSQEHHSRQSGGIQAVAAAAAAAAATADEHPDRAPAHGSSAWRPHSFAGNASSLRAPNVTAAAAAAGKALDLRTVRTEPAPLTWTPPGAPQDDAAPCSDRDAAPQPLAGDDQAQSAGKVDAVQRAASAGDGLHDVAVVRVHDAPTDSSSTRLAYQQASPGAGAAATSTAVASPVSTTSSGSRKRHWQAATRDSPAALPTTAGDTGPEQGLATASSTADLQAMQVEHPHIHAAQQDNQQNQQQAEAAGSYAKAPSQHQMQMQQLYWSPSTAQPEFRTSLQADAPFLSTSAPYQGWLANPQAAQQATFELHNSVQPQLQQSQSRLLQLPFNGRDLAERRPLVTTEPPAFVTSEPPAAAIKAPSQQATKLPYSQLPLTRSPAGAPPGAGIHWPAHSSGAASAAGAATANAGAAGLGSQGTSIDVAATSAETFLRPRAVPHRGAKAARTAAGGVTSPTADSPALQRHQSLSDGTAAAIVAAAVAAGGGGGGSGDLSGYLGGIGSPGVYRTSSGKVLRMLTHPVTGKPLLLGPAVDAKSSRLGNTSLGAPSPQLFGLDLQHTPLSSIHPPPPPNATGAAPAAATSSLTGSAGLNGPGLIGARATSGTTAGRAISRQGSASQRHNLGGSLAAAGAEQQVAGPGGSLLGGLPLPAVMHAPAHAGQLLQGAAVEGLTGAPPAFICSMGVAGMGGPGGSVPVSIGWDQQQQPMSVVYEDDGLLSLGAAGEQPQQAGLRYMDTAAAAIGTSAALAAAVAAEGGELAFDETGLVGAFGQPAGVASSEFDAVGLWPGV